MPHHYNRRNKVGTKGNTRGTPRKKPSERKGRPYGTTLETFYRNRQSDPSRVFEGPGKGIR